MTEVATAIGLADFDSPTFHDRPQRAEQTAMVWLLQVTTAVLGLSRSLLGLTGVTAALFVLSPLLLVVALLGLVLSGWPRSGSRAPSTSSWSR